MWLNVFCLVSTDDLQRLDRVVEIVDDNFFLRSV